MKTKNDPTNRNLADKKYCAVCSEEKKPVLMAGSGKKKRCLRCKCSTFDKQGIK